MRRIAVMLGFCALLLPMAAWADGIGFINQFGSVTITNAGIVSTGSELKGFNGITAPPGHSLGSVSFSTGALTSGSLWSGGTFSSAGSSFIVTGGGQYGVPKGTIFDASFVGPIKWTLVSHTGKWDYVFMLSGVVSGEIYTGRWISGTTKQTIYVYKNQWARDHRGSIHLGDTNFHVGPEPGTLGLFGTGLIVLVGTMRRKLFGS
jgi:hypothetical protein